MNGEVLYLRHFKHGMVCMLCGFVIVISSLVFMA